MLWAMVSNLVKLKALDEIRNSKCRSAPGKNIYYGNENICKIINPHNGKPCGKSMKFHEILGNFNKIKNSKKLDEINFGFDS